MYNMKHRFQLEHFVTMEREKSNYEQEPEPAYRPFDSRFDTVDTDQSSSKILHIKTILWKITLKAKFFVEHTMDFIHLAASSDATCKHTHTHTSLLGRIYYNI